MIRGLFRLILVVALLVGVGGYLLGYRWSDLGLPDARTPAGTSGVFDEEDRARAREKTAEIGQTVAAGADQAQKAAGDASVTAKIKAKMALDDGVTATNINVDTNGATVTLSGRVASATERDRALRLARETDGVTSVVDKLVVSN